MPKLTQEQLKQIEDYIKTLPEQEREPKLREILAQLENDQPQQCPFCLMSENKIKTTKIYEDETFLGVLEINPANKGHTLLFTKRHIKSLSQSNDQETEEVMRIVKKLSTAISKIFEGINILVSEGQVSGQKFEHLVINLIPRMKEDQVTINWQPMQQKPEDLEKIKEQIVKNFPQVEKPKPQPVDEDEVKRSFSRLKKRLP